MAGLEPPVALADGAVRLRPLRAEDATAYVAAFAADPELGALVGFEEDPDEDWVRERIAGAAERAGFELAVTTDGYDDLRGMIIVREVEIDHGRAEVGFWLTRDARGAGVATRAVALVVGWLFADAGLRRIELTTTAANAPSQALARRLGFTREGVLRRRNVERGRTVDTVWFGLLRDEWSP